MKSNRGAKVINWADLVTCLPSSDSAALPTTQFWWQLLDTPQNKSFITFQNVFLLIWIAAEGSPVLLFYVLHLCSRLPFAAHFQVAFASNSSVSAEKEQRRFG